jgi:hypothetical protein
MAALSDYAEKAMLDWLLGGATPTRPTTRHLALFTAAPSDSGGGTEVSTGGYARQTITFAAAATPGGTCANDAVESFTASGANYGTVTHIGIFDAATSGNLLAHGAMTVSRTVNDGDTLNFAIGSVVLTLA